jgi:hypothetical protein
MLHSVQPPFLDYLLPAVLAYLKYYLCCSGIEQG